MRAIGLEFKFKNAKDTFKTHQSMHVDCKFDSDDEKKEVAEFIWASEAKPYACSSLKPIPKNRQEQVRFTFDVSKCDRIFDELLRSENIKLSHVIPPLEELKQHAYCKWHNTFSHATNDCNIFRRKIQSAVNEGRLVMHEVKDDKASFPVHTIDLDNVKVLIRPEQAEGAKGKNVIIGEPRPKNINDKIQAREVTMEKTPDGKESLKITVKGSRRVGLQLRHDRSDRSPQPVRPVRQKAGPQISSLRGREEVLRRLMSQRCRGVLQSRSSPSLSYCTNTQRLFQKIGH